MQELTQESIRCPYCGESIDVLIDPGDEGAEYVEDCQVCCRPMVLSVSSNSVGLQIEVRSEND